MSGVVSEVIKSSQHHWHVILNNFGITVSVSTSKKIPCPMCGGKDRFRFDNKEGQGTYICNQCGSGDGLNLLSGVQGNSLQEAAIQVKEYLSVNPCTESRLPKVMLETDKQIKRKTKQEAKKVLGESGSGSSLYLKNKGLEQPECFILNKPYMGLKSPLLVIPFERESETVTLQFISETGDKRFLSGVGTQAKSYHQIAGKTDQIFIGEGYATTLTPNKITGCMGYVSGSSSNIPSVALTAKHIHPESKIIILIDNNDAGIKAFDKAIKLVPDCIGIAPPDKAKDIKDWNDYFQKHGKDQTKKALKDTVCNPTNDHIIDVTEVCKKLQYTQNNNLMSELEAKCFAVNLINKNHAMAFVGSKAVVIQDMGNPEFKLPTSFKDWGEHLSIPYLNDRGERKIVNAVSVWASQPDRRTYNYVYFHPVKVKSGGYNLWRGFDMKGKHVRGHPLCQKFLVHLFDNVCDGHFHNYQYLVAWMADIFQNPQKKTGTALVLRSDGRGTGKSKVAEVLGKLIGSHSVKVSNAEHLLGKFNAHLATSILVTVEESFWAGDKSAEGKLKDFITGETITIEPKFINAIEVDSFHRVVMITNNEWAVPASYDERRFFVLDVADHKKQDRKYFKELTDDLKDGGYQQLMDYLVNYDYSDIDIGKAPHTNGLKSQVIESLDHAETFWYNCLREGSIGELALNEYDETEISKKYVYGQYLDYLKSINVRSVALSDRSFGKKLKKTCPSVNTVKTTIMSHLLNQRTNGYQFPQLETCRQDFNKSYCLEIDWT